MIEETPQTVTYSLAWPGWNLDFEERSMIKTRLHQRLPCGSNHLIMQTGTSRQKSGTHQQCLQNLKGIMQMERGMKIQGKSTTSYNILSPWQKTFASWNAPSGQDMLDWLDRRPRDIAWLYSRGVKCISLTEISYLWRHASNTHISQSVQEFQTPNLGVQTSATRCSLQSGVRVHSAVFIDNNPGIYVVTWRSLRCTSNLEKHQPAYGKLIFFYIDIGIDVHICFFLGSVDIFFSIIGKKRTCIAIKSCHKAMSYENIRSKIS